MSRFFQLFGFKIDDVKTWSRSIQLLNRPEDPSSLAIFRILFGILMMIDIPNERGMSAADYEYGSNEFCNFPLFDFLKPMSAQWMVVIYAIMFLGAFGITIGLFYRLSCLLFVIPYWYLFFLDKTTWNNHSYLYGLLGLQLLFYDANRFLSVDALLRPNINNTHIPLWNYFIIRTQFFLVYFLAGLKKLDYDWVNGYSMGNLSSHWVFDPFKYFMTEEQIGILVVHLGGLIIDLFSGFLLFFDKTRIIGVIFTSSFHCMNSRMFSIGMFPYAMLASTAIFYSNNWPKRLVNYLFNGKYDKLFDIKSLNSHCIYDKSIIKQEDKAPLNTQISLRHKICTLSTIFYLFIQLFLPYSHFITQGYNNWTNGLYGYSWDMMVHSWHTQHIKIHFLDKTTNKVHYLKPKAWTDRRRWSSHADMIYQYSRCIEKKLNALNYTNIELYMDIWRSMNQRFNQRQIDPRVNLLKAEWNPFKPTSWLMPLLTDLSDWRTKMHEIQQKQYVTNQNYDLTFVADFPGLVLENYIDKGIEGAVEVLNGKINIQISKKKNVTLNVGDRFSLPSNAYHYVYTISDVPSCYYYIYTNETAIIYSNLTKIFIENMLPIYEETLEDLVKIEVNQNMNNLTFRAYQMVTTALNDETLLEKLINRTQNNRNKQQQIRNLVKILKKNSVKVSDIKNHVFKSLYDTLNEKYSQQNIPFINHINKKVHTYLYTFKRSFYMVYFALRSIYSGIAFETLLANEFYR